MISDLDRADFSPPETPEQLGLGEWYLSRFSADGLINLTSGELNFEFTKQNRKVTYFSLEIVLYIDFSHVFFSFSDLCLVILIGLLCSTS